MRILPYKLATTNDLLTSRAGLLTLAHLMERLKLADRIDNQFPVPGSNRGLPPSAYMTTLILMHHDGSVRLDDVRHLHDDEALRTLLGLYRLPQATTLGDWLRRMGGAPGIQTSWERVNQSLLQSALHRCKGITLDIDATEIISHKAHAKWTYKKHKGYMPMVGHIAQTGQVVAVDFREGNVAPATANLEFIKQCQNALPAGYCVNQLRIDAAGYQTNIIKYCDSNDIEYAIRAKSSADLRAQIDAIKEDDWQPLIGKNGEPIEGAHICRTSHCIGDYSKAFTVIIQRKTLEGQVSLDLGTQADAETITANGYLYRAIATNRDNLTDSDIVHWYNQRAEDSENRIKELKLDFGGDTLPCSDFAANRLYFLTAALSYNLFALMRQLLPGDLASHRAMTIRWRLYAIAAKVVKTGRQHFVKLRAVHQELLERVLMCLKGFDPPPV